MDEIEDTALTEGIETADKPPDHIVAMVSIFKGAAINLFGISAHLLLVFGYSVFLARVLDAGDLGRYFLGFSMLNFLVIVSMLGLDFAIWRYVALYIGKEESDNARSVIISSLVIAAPSSLLFAVMWFISSGWIAETFFDDAELAHVFKWFAFALPFMVVARIFNASTQGLRKMRYQVISKDLGEQVSRFALSVVLVSSGIVGILFANIAAVAISAILAFWFLQQNLPIIGIGKIKRQYREVLHYSMPLAFSTVFSYLLLWLDTWILGFYEGSVDVGLYSIAGRVAILGTLVLASFNTMFAPVIADLYNRAEMERLKILFKFVTKWVVIISLPIFMIVVIFSIPLLGVFGNDFKTVSISLIILAAGQFINSSTGPVAGMVLMSGKPYMDLANNMSAVILNIILCVLLIPVWGIVGAAIANGVTQATINIIRAAEIYFIMDLHGYDLTYLKPIFSAGIATAIIYCLFIFIGMSEYWAVALLIGTFIFSYSLIMARFGLSHEDKAMVRLIKERLVG